ncbi:MAG: S8 family serine peptidase, partial [Desulfobacterales bacterium]|nr:S8 family serine peptidase [Desulfobacterales bacterium]
GEILVKFRGSTGAAAAHHYKSMYSINPIETFESTEIRRQKLPDNMTVEQAVDLYTADPDVEYAEPNYVYRQMATSNDTYNGVLWGLNNTGQSVNGTSGTFDADIDAEEAWDLNTGSAQVVVAVIDSGVDYNHPDLSVNIWTNTGEIPSNGIDDDGNGYIDDVRGWDFAHDDNDPMDATGHGTHVAGSIAAYGNNAYGVTGVNWRAAIMPLRFINAAGYGTTADAIQAILYAEANGAMVINNSWGGASYSLALKNAIEAAAAVVVCAAGNSGNNLDTTPEYPASFNSANIISVAASDQNDNLASFSNYSSTLADVAAPGTNIYSTEPPRTTVWSDNFGDGNISDWTSGGTNNNWALETAGPYAGLGVITESPGGVNYLNSTDAWIRSPQFNLSSRNGSRFEFRVIGASESGQDILKVEASTNGSTWTQVPVNVGDIMFDNITGTLSSWRSAVADIGAYDG